MNSKLLLAIKHINRNLILSLIAIKSCQSLDLLRASRSFSFFPSVPCARELREQKVRSLYFCHQNLHISKFFRTFAVEMGTMTIRLSWRI